MSFYIAKDGYGDIAIWEGDSDPLIRKCDLPPKTRDRVWDLLVAALIPAHDKDN